MLERDYSCSSTSVQVAGETTGNQKSKKGKKPLKRLIKMLRSEVVLDQQSAAASWYILVVTPVLTSTRMLYHTPVRFLCPPRLPLSSLLLSLSLSLSSHAYQLWAVLTISRITACDRHLCRFLPADMPREQVRWWVKQLLELGPIGGYIVRARAHWFTSYACTSCLQHTHAGWVQQHSTSRTQDPIFIFATNLQAIFKVLKWPSLLNLVLGIPPGAYSPTAPRSCFF